MNPGERTAARADGGARALRELARLYGVQTSYVDVIARRRRSASDSSLTAVLQALGAPLATARDAAEAVRQRRQAQWQRPLEPVVVAWDGGGALDVRLPAAHAQSSVNCRLTLENGESRAWSLALASLQVPQAAEVEGCRYEVRRLTLPEGLPLGYHRLTVEFGSTSAETLLLAAPRAAYVPRGDGAAARTWGVFLPLHALQSSTGWGTGDFGDLDRLMEWVAGQGGGVVATLPFLAAFLDQPCEPSPYAPASRLFWNELFLHLRQIPELQHTPAAQALLASPEVERERQALQAASLVDYRRAMALKRKILEPLAAALLAQDNQRAVAFRRFLDAHPLLQDYARFRAVGERLRQPWLRWPTPLRDGEVHPGDYDEAAWHYHTYVQWLAHAQLQAFAEKARRHGPGLYLDLPLGVHPDSYDVWRERSSFAAGVSGGAPPDSFFTKGQDWGFPPLHPERMREQEHRYFIACVRHHLRYAGILRIDHVMGLHRLFWVPRGCKAIEGVYVRYPAEELYAILALESQRARSFVVGEDLGTVPPAVRPAMARHRIHRAYVLQYELGPDPARALRPPGRNFLAGLNTHDMPTFAAFRQGLDVDDRVELDLLDAEGARAERTHRRHLLAALAAFLQRQGWLPSSTPTPEELLRACLAYLAASPARVLAVNLEDLWGEQQPQNVPGTGTERPNWRRKARYAFEEFCQMPLVLATLEEVNRQRQRAKDNR